MLITRTLICKNVQVCRGRATAVYYHIIVRLIDCTHCMQLYTNDMILFIILLLETNYIL